MQRENDRDTNLKTLQWFRLRNPSASLMNCLLTWSNSHFSFVNCLTLNWLRLVGTKKKKEREAMWLYRLGNLNQSIQFLEFANESVLPWRGPVTFWRASRVVGAFSYLPSNVTTWGLCCVRNSSSPTVVCIARVTSKGSVLMGSPLVKKIDNQHRIIYHMSMDLHMKKLVSNWRSNGGGD